MLRINIIISSETLQRVRRKKERGVHMLRKSAIASNSNITITTEELMNRLQAGRITAVSIGIAAGARIQIGRRVLWNVSKIQKYLDSVSE